MPAEEKHILLIDDDPDMHHAIRVMLEPEGYRITCALTGPIGMEAVRRDHPDLVLLDIMLATPSEGFHLAYELRRDEATRHIPIIMISAIGHVLGMDFAREAGSDYMQAELFLEKPLDAARLRESVRRVLAASEKRVNA